MYDPITGLAKKPYPHTASSSGAKNQFRTSGLGKGLIPTTESVESSKGAINAQRNSSQEFEGLLRHDRPQEPLPVGAPSRVNRGNLQTNLIPEGDPDAPYTERPLLRQAPGDYGIYMIPRDKLGPGLRPTGGAVEPAHIRMEPNFGRSNLQQTPLGIIARENAGREPGQLPSCHVGEESGKYVRKYGQS